MPDSVTMILERRYAKMGKMAPMKTEAREPKR
jgi:hypothetical protein